MKLNIKNIILAAISICLLSVPATADNNPLHYGSVGEWNVYQAKDGEYCYALREYPDHNQALSVAYLTTINGKTVDIISIMFSGRDAAIVAKPEQIKFALFSEDEALLFSVDDGIFVNDGNVARYAVMLDKQSRTTFWTGASLINAAGFLSNPSDQKIAIVFKADKMGWALLETLKCKLERFGK